MTFDNGRLTVRGSSRPSVTCAFTLHGVCVGLRFVHKPRLCSTTARQRLDNNPNVTGDASTVVHFGEGATNRFFGSATRVKTNGNTAESLTEWIAITTLFTLLSAWPILRRNNSRAPVKTQESSTTSCAQWCDRTYPATSTLMFMPLSFQQTSPAHIYN